MARRESAGISGYSELLQRIQAGCIGGQNVKLFLSAPLEPVSFRLMHHADAWLGVT